MSARDLIVRLIATLALVATAACSQPLPEEGSADARLYVDRCGRCHAVYMPGMLTSAMWEAMVGRMEGEMKRRGRPLDPVDRERILAYLQRNAGTR